MSRSTDQGTTAEQLAAMPDEGQRYELVDGVLHRMSPAGGEHGEVAAILLARLTIHARRHRLGKTHAAETGFLIRRDPDTVLAPDASFVSFERLGSFSKHPGYLPVVPDLVAEVASPNDRASELTAKAQTWLEAGVRVVLVVEPRTSTVREHRPGRRVRVHSEGVIDLDDVLRGLQLDVGDLFL